MKTFTKIIFFSLVLLILVGLAVLWNVNSVVETFRPQIQEVLSKAVSAPVTFGKVNVRFLPNIAIQISNVVIKSDSDNTSESSSIETLLLSSSLQELFQGRVAVSNIGIKNASITAKKNSNGIISVAGVPLSEEASQADDNTGSTPKAEPKTAAKVDNNPHSEITSEQTNDTQASTGSTTEPPPSTISFNIDSVNITDTSFTWIDESVEPTQKIKLSRIDIALAQIDLSGKAQVDLSANLLSDNQKSLQLTGIAGNPFAGQPLNLNLTLSDINLTKLSQILDAYNLTVKDAHIANTISLSSSISTQSNKIILTTKLDGNNTDLKFADLFQKNTGTDLSLDLKAAASFDKSVAANTVNFRLGDIFLNLPFTISPGGDMISLSLNSSRFPLDNLSTMFLPLNPYNLVGNLKSALAVQLDRSKKNLNPNVNGTIELHDVGASISLPAKKNVASRTLNVKNANATIAFKEDTVSSKNVNLTVADQELNIAFKLSSLTNPALALVLKSEHLKLGQILKSMAHDIEKLNDSFLDDLRITATYGTSNGTGSTQLISKKAQIAKIDANDIKIAVDLKRKSVVLKPSSLNVFGGSIDVNGKLSKGPSQHASLTLKGSGLNAKTISKAVIPPTSSISLSGTLSQIAARANTNIAELLPTLSGTANFELSKGAIEGINIVNEALSQVTQIPGLTNALNAYIPQEHRATLDGNATKFDRFTGDFNIEKQNVSAKTILLEHPLYNISGRGDIGFDGSVNLNTQLQLTPLLAKGMVLKQPKLNLLLDKNGNIVFPVIIKRNKGSLLVIPDTSQLLKRAAKNTAKETIKRQIDKIAPGLGGASGVLDSLFK